LPDAGNTLHVRLAAKLAVGADLARDARDLFGERVQLVDHRVDGLLQLQDLSPGVSRVLLRQVALLVCVGDLGLHAALPRQVGGHGVDVVGQVLPDPGNALDVGLAAQLSFRADLAGDTRHLAREGVELVDHRVDGLLELEDLPTDVDGDLLRQVALLDGGGDLGDVADLARQVAGHEVDVLGQVLPDAGRAPDVGLAPKPALGTDLPGHARDLVGEGVELVDHRVDGVLELQDLSLDVDRDLLRQVAVGDAGGDLGDVADLSRQLARPQVDVLGQVFPDARHALDVRLAAQLALGADLAGDARHLAREGVQLVDHRVDGVLELEDLSADIDRDLLREVTLLDGRRDLGAVAHRAGQGAGHQVHVVGDVLPHAANPTHVRLATGLAPGSHLARYTRHLAREGVELADHRV